MIITLSHLLKKAITSTDTVQMTILYIFPCTRKKRHCWELVNSVFVLFSSSSWASRKTYPFLQIDRGHLTELWNIGRNATRTSKKGLFVPRDLFFLALIVNFRGHCVYLTSQWMQEAIQLIFSYSQVKFCCISHSKVLGFVFLLCSVFFCSAV